MARNRFLLTLNDRGKLKRTGISKDYRSETYFSHLTSPRLSFGGGEWEFGTELTCVQECCVIIRRTVEGRLGCGSCDRWISCIRICKFS